MRRIVRSVPRRRRYVAFAILALAVAAAAALTTGSVRAPFASAAGADTCGYSGGTTPTTAVPRDQQKFNEIGIAEGFSVTSGGTPSQPLTVNIFYSDEHALTLGQGSPPATTQWTATYSKPSSTVKQIDDAGTNPAGLGTDPQPDPATVATGNPAAIDPGGRPVYPALFITDLTVNGATSRAGDWQADATDTANSRAQSPNYVGGTWKPAGAANPLGSDGKVATNGVNLGPHSEAFVRNISSAQGIEAYGAEIRWDVKNLNDSNGDPLRAGHTYRVQMIIHDGDHVADTGEACVNFTVPKAPSTTETAPKVKVEENIDVKVNVSTSTGAEAHLKAGDTARV
jgi:hypothetical protein